MSENFDDVNNVFSKSVDDASKGIHAKVNEATESIAHNYDNISNALTDVFNRKVSTWLSKIDFEGTIEAIENYQKDSGKDVSALTDFINKLKNIK